jgi:protein-S-isoprenylcysteine O-methyltransferase Ste14
LFLGTFSYAIAFVGNLPVPKTIDTPSGDAWPMALLIDLGLLGLFAVQHSVMARRGFKRWWTRIIPESAERSTYVLIATALLALICWQWRAIPAPVWTVTDPSAVLLLKGLFWLGWGMVLLSTFLINHFELFGLRQVVANLVRGSIPAPTFYTPLLYRYVRHPLYLGFIIAFWAAPSMSVGHLVFAIACTGYILVGIWFEERDLIAQFGDRYRQYRTQVGMLLPRFGKKASGIQSSNR